MATTCAIRVLARFRPINQREVEEEAKTGASQTFNLEFLDQATVKITEKLAGSHTFPLDRIFPPNTDQVTVYEDCGRPTIEDIIKGYNGTIFAYGQTGSGKSFTMFGPDISNIEMRGVIPRAADHIFSHIENDQEEIDYQVRCSFLEIYKEKICDLLDIKSRDLQIRESPQKGIFVEGLSEESATSLLDVDTLLKIGEKGRHAASTLMNAVSSRSHSVFIMTLIQKTRDGTTKQGKLNLVDLAGSEKIGKTGAQGETLEEAKKINQSLSALGNCIHAITENNKHIPFRDSKLTRILQESLEGNTKTSIIVACSPHQFNVEETVSTLRFAQRAKTIKLTVKTNTQRSAEELLAMLMALQKEVQQLRRINERLKMELDWMQSDDYQPGAVCPYNQSQNEQSENQLGNLQGQNSQVSFGHSESQASLGLNGQQQQQTLDNANLTEEEMKERINQGLSYNQSQSQSHFSALNTQTGFLRSDFMLNGQNIIDLNEFSPQVDAITTQMIQIQQHQQQSQHQLQKQQQQLQQQQQYNSDLPISRIQSLQQIQGQNSTKSSIYTITTQQEKHPFSIHSSAQEREKDDLVTEALQLVGQMIESKPVLKKMVVASVEENFQYDDVILVERALQIYMNQNQSQHNGKLNLTGQLMINNEIKNENSSSNNSITIKNKKNDNNPKIDDDDLLPTVLASLLQPSDKLFQVEQQQQQLQIQQQSNKELTLESSLSEIEAELQQLNKNIEIIEKSNILNIQLQHPPPLLSSILFSTAEEYVTALNTKEKIVDSKKLSKDKLNKSKEGQGTMKKQSSEADVNKKDSSSNNKDNNSTNKLQVENSDKQQQQHQSKHTLIHQHYYINANQAAESIKVSSRSITNQLSSYLEQIMNKNEDLDDEMMRFSGDDSAQLEIFVAAADSVADAVLLLENKEISAEKRKFESEGILQRLQKLCALVAMEVEDIRSSRVEMMLQIDYEKKQKEEMELKIKQQQQQQEEERQKKIALEQEKLKVEAKAKLQSQNSQSKLQSKQQSKTKAKIEQVKPGQVGTIKKGQSTSTLSTQTNTAKKGEISKDPQTSDKLNENENNNKPEQIPSTTNVQTMEQFLTRMTERLQQKDQLRSQLEDVISAVDSSNNQQKKELEQAQSSKKKIKDELKSIEEELQKEEEEAREKARTFAVKLRQRSDEELQKLHQNEKLNQNTEDFMSESSSEKLQSFQGKAEEGILKGSEALQKMMKLWNSRIEQIKVEKELQKAIEEKDYISAKEHQLRLDQLKNQNFDDNNNEIKIDNEMFMTPKQPQAGLPLIRGLSNKSLKQQASNQNAGDVAQQLTQIDKQNLQLMQQMMNLSYTDRTQEIINDSKISHDEKFKFDLNQQLNEQQQQQQEYLTEEYLAARNSESEEDAHFFAEFMSKLESLLGDAKDQKQRMKVLSSEETIEIQNVGEYMEKRRIKNENFKNQLEQEIEEMNKINKFKEKDAKIKLKLMEKRVNQAELTGEIDEKQAIEDVNNEELGEFQIIQTDQQQQLNQTAQKDKSGNALKKQSSSSSLKKQTSTSSLLSTPVNNNTTSNNNNNNSNITPLSPKLPMISSPLSPQHSEKLHRANSSSHLSPPAIHQKPLGSSSLVQSQQQLDTMKQQQNGQQQQYQQGNTLKQASSNQQQSTLKSSQTQVPKLLSPPPMNQQQSSSTLKSPSKAKQNSSSQQQQQQQKDQQQKEEQQQLTPENPLSLQTNLTLGSNLNQLSEYNALRSNNKIYLPTLWQQLTQPQNTSDAQMIAETSALNQTSSSTNQNKNKQQNQQQQQKQSSSSSSSSSSPLPLKLFPNEQQLEKPLPTPREQHDMQVQQQQALENLLITTLQAENEQIKNDQQNQSDNLQKKEQQINRTKEALENIVQVKDKIEEDGLKRTAQLILLLNEKKEAQKAIKIRERKLRKKLEKKQKNNLSSSSNTLRSAGLKQIMQDSTLRNLSNEKLFSVEKKKKIIKKQLQPGQIMIVDSDSDYDDDEDDDQDQLSNEEELANLNVKNLEGVNEEQKLVDEQFNNILSEINNIAQQQQNQQKQGNQNNNDNSSVLQSPNNNEQSSQQKPQYLQQDPNWNSSSSQQIKSLNLIDKFKLRQNRHDELALLRQQSESVLAQSQNDIILLNLQAEVAKSRLEAQRQLLNSLKAPYYAKIEEEKILILEEIRLKKEIERVKKETDESKQQFGQRKLRQGMETSFSVVLKEAFEAKALKSQKSASQVHLPPVSGKFSFISEFIHTYSKKRLEAKKQKVDEIAITTGKLYKENPLFVQQQQRGEEVKLIVVSNPLKLTPQGPSKKE